MQVSVDQEIYMSARCSEHESARGRENGSTANSDYGTFLGAFPRSVVPTETQRHCLTLPTRRRRTMKEALPRTSPIQSAEQYTSISAVPAYLS
jgi:hypothetical protein